MFICGYREPDFGGKKIVENNPQTQPILLKQKKGTPQPTKTPVEKAYLVGAELPGSDADWTVDDSLAELTQLSETAGLNVVGQMSQRLRVPSPATFFGKGKVEEIAAQRTELGFELVVVDNSLTPTQQRNLEKGIGCRVIERTALILYIFSQRAQTREGRLQVELAQLEYELPRLTGQWTHLERQAGGTGTTGGPGETQLEVDRRKARARISDVRAEIEKVRAHREHYRRRRELAGLPVVALVGYTNAGKSTLLNALTKAGVLSEDKLFATLDPTTRRYVLPTGQQVLLTDTVGFIQKLPTTLVAAFRATLEELESADLLLHVVDVTHPKGYEQGKAVGRIIDELGLRDLPAVTALNKIDLLAGQDAGENGASPPASPADLPSGARQMLAELEASYPNAVAVSAVRGWGLANLGARIEAVLARDWLTVTVRIPYSADEAIQRFRTRARVTDEKYLADVAVLTGQIPKRLLRSFEEYLE